jgi:hypothetical protein
MSDINVQEIYAQLNAPRILVAMLEKMGEVSIPVTQFLTAITEDKELQIDYNEEDQTFLFKLNTKD